jgi:hypothetical protein
MAHSVYRRQKPIWQQIRKPLPPPTKPHSTKKGKRGYDRKEHGWKRDLER